MSKFYVIIIVLGFASHVFCSERELRSHELQKISDVTGMPWGAIANARVWDSSLGQYRIDQQYLDHLEGYAIREHRTKQALVDAILAVQRESGSLNRSLLAVERFTGHLQSTQAAVTSASVEVKQHADRLEAITRTFHNPLIQGVSFAAVGVFAFWLGRKSK